MDKIEKVSVNGQVYELAGSGGGSSTPVSITYSELVALKNSSSLVAGTKYRITDYVPTFKSGLKSGGHQFDIIVTAESSSSLKSKAQAVQHDGDAYFSECKLYDWEIWYDIENDTSRYQFANSEGKGYIYRMIDEYGNDVPWDFKNAMFGLSNSDNEVIPEEKNTVYFYTFSITDSYTEYSKIEDASIKGKCFNNQIKESVSALIKIPNKVVISIISNVSPALIGNIYNNLIMNNTTIFSNLPMAMIGCNNIYTRFNTKGAFSHVTHNTVNGDTAIKNSDGGKKGITNNIFKGNTSLTMSGSSYLESNMIYGIGTEGSFNSYSTSNIKNSIIKIDNVGTYNISNEVDGAIVSGVSGSLNIKKFNDM